MKRKKIKKITGGMGKKGFEVIGDIPTWFITALIIFIFMILFTMARCAGYGKERVSEKSIAVEMAQQDVAVNYNSLNFLRQPVEVDGQNMTIADLVDARMEVGRVYKKASAAPTEDDKNVYPELPDDTEINFLGKDAKVSDVKDIFNNYRARANALNEKMSLLENKYAEGGYVVTIKKGDIEATYGSYKSPNIVGYSLVEHISTVLLPSYDGEMTSFTLSAAEYEAQNPQPKLEIKPR